MNRNFSELIAKHQENFTVLERRIAAYLLANPSAVLVDTSGAIAENVHVSPMTVTRFFKKIGFEDAAAARDSVRHQLAGRAISSIDSRFEEFRRSRGLPDQYAHYEAAALAIKRACEYRETPIWKEIISLITSANSVYATGFQTMGYLANGLVQRLNYVRANVHEMDGTDGVYAKLLTDPAPSKALIIIDTFRYGKNGPVLARTARDRDTKVIVFCDELCDWAAPITPYVVALPSESGFFFRPTTAIHFILGLLIQDVIDSLGESVRKQMSLLSEAQELFGQYIK